MKKGIKYRWDSRVVPNGWDKTGSTGAQAYLAKYGKQITITKLGDLAAYAESQGCNEFAEEMRRYSKGIVDAWNNRLKQYEQGR